MMLKVCLFFVGEVVVGIIAAILSDVVYSGDFLLRRLPFVLSITFYVVMNLWLLSYRNKYIDEILGTYFSISIFGLTCFDMRALSLLQWCGYELYKDVLAFM